MSGKFNLAFSHLVYALTCHKNYFEGKKNKGTGNKFIQHLKASSGPRYTNFLQLDFNNYVLEFSTQVITVTFTSKT